MTTQALIEAFDLTEATIIGERTVRQRIINSGTSLNKNHYPAAVLQRAAPLFENVQTFRDHESSGPRKFGRSAAELTGWITNVEFKEGALYGVRHFTRTQAGEDSWRLAEDIISGRAPASLLGASINAGGKGKRDKMGSDEVFIVESIDVVKSVDDVVSPSAGGGFFSEAIDGATLTRELLMQMDYEEWRESRTDYIGRLKREWQTVQQTDAIKAAKADANRLSTALAEAQANIDRQRAELERLQADLELERLRRGVIDVLEGTKLPVKMQRKLRTQLWEAEPSQWNRMIEQALEMLTLAGGGASRVSVSGAGQHVAPALALPTQKPAIKPLNMNVIDTPEKLAEALKSYKRQS